MAFSGKDKWNKKFQKPRKEFKEELKIATKNENEDKKAQLRILIDGLEEEKAELQKQALLTAEERAKELGYDAGFGPKKYAFDVASFAVSLMKQKKIKTKMME